MTRLQRATKDQYLLAMTLMATTRSEDPWRRVGCVVANKKGRVLATGYNGLRPGKTLPDEIWQNRDERLKHVVHAEANALECVRKNGKSYTIATTLQPCLECAKKIYRHRIRRAIYMFDYRRDPSGPEYLRKHGIDVIQYSPKEIWEIARENIESLFHQQEASDALPVPTQEGDH